MSYGLKLGAAAAAFLIVGVVIVLIFDHIWFQIGFGAAFGLLCAVLLIFAWRVDKKAKEERAGLENV